MAHLGPDKDLHTLDKCEFDARLGIDSPGEKLWNLLRGHRDKDYIGLGPTITSKLMARKRPGLIPIWDSRVGNQVGLRSTEHFWTGMWSAFQDEALVHNLREIRDKAGHDIPRISLLRVFDVCVWHFDKFLDADGTPRDPKRTATRRDSGDDVTFIDIEDHGETAS